MKQIQVELGERSYPVIIGTECLAQALDSLLPKQAKRAAIVTQPNIGITPATSIEQETFHIGDGENAKTLKTIEDLCSKWAQWGLTRTDVVITIGGGLVTDVAGLSLIHI